MKKFNVKIKTTIAVILSLLCLNPSSARTDDSDIFGANIEPNVLLLIDSSGSMKRKIPSSIYSPSTVYDGLKVDTKVYKENSNDTNYSVYRQSISDVPSSTAQAALSTVGYWVGRIGGSTVSLYIGNYINFLSYSAAQLQIWVDANCTTDPCKQPGDTGYVAVAGVVMERKIDIAMRVYANIVRNVEGVRFGVMRLRRDGGEMVSPIGTDTATMAAAIEAMDNFGGVGTPLGDQLYDGGRYYKGTFNYNGTWPSPIQYECQPNFVILMSDGKENNTPNFVVEEATLRFTEDHSSLTGDQIAIVHTIGFDLSGIPDPTDRLTANQTLIDAATNGGGTFFASDNAADLEQNLQDAIQLIVGAVFTFATPVVPTTSTTGSTRAYVAAVQSDPDSVFWRGYLKAYDRQADGSILLDADGIPDSSKLAWEAGDVLNNKLADDRKIYYQSVPILPGQPRVRENFVWNKVPPGLLGLAPSDTSQRDQIVNFIRGEDVFDEDGDANITENRAWILGDIFHSTPVLVSQPRMPIVDPTYDTFKADSAVTSRPTVLIVGANDGMLHAFRESDGEELWAWVPEHVFPNLKDLLASSGAHPYFVDGSPVSADIKIDGQWETIVVFGLRRGGRNYYALKITDTTSPELLWAFNDTNLGETWSEPSIGKIKWSDGTDKYVAFVGGGYNTNENNDSGKAFFMIDLATGAKLAEYYNDGVTTDDRQYMNFSIPANPTAIDKDGDRYVDRVYVGDVGGQLWRFEPRIETTVVSGPTSYTYEFLDKDSTVLQRDFTKKFADGVVNQIQLKKARNVLDDGSPPAECQPTCYAYDATGGTPSEDTPSSDLGFVGPFNQGIYGSGHEINNLVLISENGGVTTSDFHLDGKRLFAADPSQANPPAVGEYLPAQAIYGAPSVALDDKGNLWTYFGTGDRNHPLNTTVPPNRFYGIKDNALIDDVVTLTESDLQLVDSTDDVVSALEDGWYFVFEGTDEKVLASAEVFDNTVYFTTFTPDPDSTNVCGSGGGTANLYAVRMTSGFAALDFSTADNDAYAATAKELGTSRWTKIGDGIASKPGVIIDKYGNPSIITGTTSQQISSEKAPKISNTGLLGWMEVF